MGRIIRYSWIFIRKVKGEIRIIDKEKDFFKTCFNTVAGLEVKNESEAIAKEVGLSGIETLEQQCKKQKEIINKAIEYINENLIISSILDGKKYYTISDYSFDYRELLDILNEVTNNE